MTSRRTTSLWRSRPHDIPSTAFVEDRYDDAVVGGGLTGMLTALLLARRGRRVVVVEARQVGSVATGNSTAKLSLLQGSQLQSIRSSNIAAVLHAYVEANRAGQRLVLDLAEELGVAVQRRDAVSYATTEQGRRTVEAEHRAAQEAGLETQLVDAVPELPFPVTGAVVLRDQAQFDAMELLAALARAVVAEGGTIHQEVRVRSVGLEDAGAVLRTDRGEIRAERAVLATGAPVLDRGLYFAKLEPMRSYAAAFSVPGRIPAGMHLSVDAPSRSLRTAPDGDRELLLVGGEGHPVGRRARTHEAQEALLAWTEQHFPGAERLHAWSAQDYSTPHHVPFVGWLPRGRGRLYVATGYEKWGMTNAAAAALTLAGDLEGGTPEWARTLHRRPTLPQALGRGIGINAAVGWWMLKGWTAALRAPRSGPAPREGRGTIRRSAAGPVAISTVEGRTCAVSAVCPHLGGVLGWNDAERSWDCPLHGSRFEADGTLIEGPATRGLAPARP